MKDSGKEGSRKPLNRDNNACMDRLRTRNRSVAQDACNDDKEFSIYVENCCLPRKNSFTDVMKINVHLTITTHTHIIIMLKLSRI